MLKNENLNKPQNQQLNKDVVGGSLPDKTLFEYYNMGWGDCADGKKEQEFKEQLLQRAYNIGWCDFIAGDDVSSVDLQTKKEILKRIKQ